MGDPLVQAQALHKSFARTTALENASIAVEPQEVVAVTGPSGSGKSTLMLCLAGVLRPESGEVRYGDVRVDRLPEVERSRLRRREFGLILQFGQLLPELSVVDNVALPLLLDGHGRKNASTAAAKWLETTGAGGLAAARPAELSGGEAQRVAVARALVTGPRVVFADEPTGALDSAGAAQVLETLLRVVDESRATLVIITHDNTVAAHATREVTLRDGRTQPATGPS